MDRHTSCLRIGITAVLCALLIRFFDAGGWQRLSEFLAQPNTAAFAIYLETGRIVRFSPSLEAELSYPGESPAPEIPPATAAEETLPPEPSLPDYTGMELEWSNYTDLTPDIPSLLARPLVWDLADGKPAVLILSTHATESYTKNGEIYQESAAWRTLSPEYNMISIGARVASRLEAAGIVVIRDESLHDYPSYNGSYASSRSSMESLLSQYPTVRLVLDLHRDASDAAFGQLRTRATVDGVPCAQLMLVMGGGHDRWEENLSLGLKLMAQLELQAPGITRPLLLRRSHFNQDLCPGALLIEVGAAGNTHPEALLAADQLAQAIIALAKGTLPLQ